MVYVGANVLETAIGAEIGMAISYYATRSITSSTGQVDDIGTVVASYIYDAWGKSSSFRCKWN